MNFSDRSEADQVNEEAMLALRNGLRYQARKLAVRSAKLDPNNEESWLILAAISSPNASIEYLKTALQINPNSERAREGMQWALERSKKEIQNRILTLLKKSQPFPTTPIQEGSVRSPATPIQEHSVPSPATLVHAQIPASPTILTQDKTGSNSEENFWQIDNSKIITPGRYVFDFILSGFFTAYHQISITGLVMGEMHPHTYRLQITASAELVTHDNQVIVSYGNIRIVLDRVCRAYEGVTLNDLPPFKDLQPTTENLVGVIAQQLETLSSGMKYRIYKVTLMESPTVGVVLKNMNIIRSFQ